jgi:hypothetical protein
MIYVYFYHKPNDTEIHIGKCEALDKKDAMHEASKAVDSIMLIGVIEENNPVFSAFIRLLYPLWPHLKMFPMCGCDHNLLPSIASVANILELNSLSSQLQGAVNNGEQDGMTRMLGWLESHPEWSIRMSRRLHGQLVADMREYITSENSGG